ncbi:MAG: tyrosine/serine/threonine protein phosphatase pps1 [Geoglossum umbratile]|nr:MAG: tyrosine/serine/threonine protein phosphatase pps1 [Geoglossum umbratile]
MATIVARQPHLRPSPTPPPPLAPALSLNTQKTGPIPVPNKHIPPLSPGSPPVCTPETPPASPPAKQLSIQTPSLLYPPHKYPLVHANPPIYSIEAKDLAAALEHLSSQPLPEPKQVFPWMHGLHVENHIQLAFFAARRKSLRRTPKCIRGITIVKAGGDLSISKLKGAISPQEILPCGQESRPGFLEVDPKDGFSVRNFQIQVGKMAMVSDIVVYGDENTDQGEVYAVAKKVAEAQALGKTKADAGKDIAPFNTFVVTKGEFSEFEKSHPSLVAVNSNGEMTGNVMDFFHWERYEMCVMSRATEISNNVWLGSTTDSGLDPTFPNSSNDDYDVLVEASDLAQMPSSDALGHVVDMLERGEDTQLVEFPSSGSIMPPTWSQTEVDGILEMCRWIYELANPDELLDAEDKKDSDGDSQMASTPGTPHRILIHCADGYTETSLLALAYFMFANGLPVHEAWLRLHCEKKRNFFAYPSDVALLLSIQSRVMHESPMQRSLTNIREPQWLRRMDGSLPSRILDYMYLGNLGHANNPELLRAMGIRRILSVGEAVSWSKEEKEKWGKDNILPVDRVQDNGVDPLTNEFSNCLEFIEKGKKDNVATLVHCRVGVSRSATICIAEVMKSQKLSFPRA